MPIDPLLGLVTMGVGGAIKVGADLFNDTGAKEAALTRKQADNKLSALEETMRRAEGAQTQVLSSTKARMAATGFSTASPSFSGYLEGMAAEFGRQNSFERKNAMGSINALNQAADIQGDPLRKFLTAGVDLAGTLGDMGALGKFGVDTRSAAEKAAAAAKDEAQIAQDKGKSIVDIILERL